MMAHSAFSLWPVAHSSSLYPQQQALFLNLQGANAPVDMATVNSLLGSKMHLTGHPQVHTVLKNQTDQAAFREQAQFPVHPVSAPTDKDIGLLATLATQSERGFAPFSHAVTANSQAQKSEAPKPACKPIRRSSPDESGPVKRVFPRRKAGQSARPNNEPVVLNEEVLSPLFDYPLQEACNRLGICATALKKACRRIGIKKWPYKCNPPTNPSPISKRSAPAKTSVDKSAAALPAPSGHSVSSLLN
eukprot:CAMPEP_0196749166 /NCGR_PEP_ID=MMETSP1091-20130531/75886_1 /TAXON_ID=302021 /ORGANISM="Rhodomonas sp., Strain CCMP768" /LENGTH=245 /DNA_ID=CAMNT_0042096597 /DNA_START=13 /DNA_END=750 /DNA_ORIENTATION=+